MSWNPVFLVKKKDYESKKDELYELESLEMWEFQIDNLDGVVMVAGESTQPSRLLHEVIQDVPHWILNGEGEGCEDCKGWGEKIER